MTRAAKIWDFLFGAVLIGGATLAALFVVWMGFFIVRPDTDVRLIGLVALIFVAVAFGAACRRRWKHRHLRRWIFFAEIFVAAFVVLLFILAVAAILRIPDGGLKEWTTFSPAGERFSVLMPITPTFSTVMKDTRAGQFPVYFYTARPSKGYAFAVTHNSFPKDADLSRIFDKTEDMTIKNGAQLISKKNITLHGIAGRELVYEKEGRVVSLRFYLIDREIYQVFCIMPEGSGHQNLVNEFLYSFQLK